MKLSKLFFGFVVSTFLLNISPTFAAPSMRGFQVDLTSMNADIVADLASTWGINVVRIQIGDNETMDGLTGAEYVEMMNEKMDLLDEKLPLFAAQNMKVVFAVYSPPGGFETRESPSHYAMFSQAALQEDYLEMLRTIAQRFGNNSSIYALDILNEPAMRADLLGAGAKNWNALLPDAIEAVREIAPNLPIMVKSLYGDPTKLASLPSLDYENIIHSYHAYPFHDYQHSGVYNAPFSQSRPSAEAVKKKLLKLLGGFYAKQMTRYNAGEISQFPPVLNVGETAVPACSIEGAAFMSSILDVLELEGDDTALIRFAAKHNKKAKKKRAKKRLPPLKKPKGADFAKWITHSSYTVHAFAESNVWDPRNQCDSQGNITRADSTTEVGAVLQSFFAKNE